jgi:phage baseplate assembly protein W
MDGSILMATAIALPFGFNISGAVNTTSINEKFWADRVYGVLFTLPMDRVMRPSFGSYTMGAVFEPQDTVVEYVNRTAAAAFAQFLPELTLVGIYITDENQGLGDEGVIISVDYELPNNQVDTITTKIGTFTRTGDLIQEIK